MPDSARVYPCLARVAEAAGSATPRSASASGGAMSGRSLATMMT
ncbi:Uncharacterised protein [Achromobacter xylosoxidans]|nr:Uncharacterised protein [Achromobacter xylosoxidans]